MNRVSKKMRVLRFTSSTRLLAGILSVGLLAALMPYGSIPAQAAAVSGTLGKADKGQSGYSLGIIVDSSIARTKVRTITFQNTKPAASASSTVSTSGGTKYEKCWNAGSGTGSAADDSVIACAAKSSAATDMYDLVYGANGKYPRFPDDASYLFQSSTHGDDDKLSGLVEIKNLDKIDTSNVTNMSGMFSNLQSLQSLNVTNFKTSKVTDMSTMFFNCSKLTSLNVSKFDTASVRSMEMMFYGCSGLKSLDLSSFKTSAVRSKSRMFFGVSKLQDLKLGAGFTLKPSDCELGEPDTSATRTGYTNIGKWRDAASGKEYASASAIPTSRTAAVTYSTFKPNVYTVTFDANGHGSAPAKRTVNYGATVSDPGSLSASGYAFGGWYTDKAGTKAWNFSTGTMPANNMTLYAKWAVAKSARLSGATRYDTMSKVISTAYPGTANTVIVASGANYPDALAASGLSGVLDAPVVLTDSSALSSQALTQLKRLNPSKIIVVGGASAVKANVVAQLKKQCAGTTITRLDGSTRYETSYKLYQQGGTSWGSTAIVATGASYADALSVSSYAYSAKAPVFLCDPNTGLTSAQRTALAKFSRVVVVGGTSAVSDKHLSGLKGVTRVSGATRYETSVKIAEWTQKNGGLSMDGVVYARGDDYPDALVAGSLAGHSKAPVLLVSDAKSAAVSYSAGFKGKVANAYVIGGTAAVSAATANALSAALGSPRF